MKVFRNFEAKMAAGFAAAVVVVCLLAAITWQVTKDAAESASAVAHTQEVLRGLATIRGDTVQIELSTQSYRISGDEARLAEREATIRSRESSLAQVRQLTADNPSQQRRWMALRKVIDERLAISKQAILLRDTRGAAAAAEFVASAPLQQTRNQVYQLLTDMDDAERQLLARRNDQYAQARDTLAGVGAMMATLLVALLATIGTLIRKQWRDAELRRRLLADSEERLATTLHSIGDGVIVADVQGRIVRMNPVAQRMTGWELAQAQGRLVDEVFCVRSEHTGLSSAAPVAKVLESGELQEAAGHQALIARDGSERFISHSTAPIRDAQGNLGGAVMVLRDETAARQAQNTIREQNELLEQRVQERTAQLFESEAHLLSVISHVPSLIAYVDAQQRYVYVNHQYRECFAPGKADITGDTVRQTLGEERYAMASPQIAKALQGQVQTYDWQPFPGLWQFINYVPKRDEQDQVLGYYVVGTDITERKQAEAQIKALNLELTLRIGQLEQVSRALRTLSAGNRAMLRAKDEQGLLASMCRAIVADGGYNMAVVWYRASDGAGRLRPMAHCGYPMDQASLQLLHTSWADHEAGPGRVAEALRSGRTTVSAHAEDHPHTGHEESVLNQVGACVACPLRVDAEVLGVLAIYGGVSDTFGADEVALLTDSADDLAFGIARLRARAQQLEIQEAMHQLTRFDALTGLPNETHFAELLNTAISDSAARGKSFAVLQTSIEQLTEINDALGFGQGDSLLREFGGRLRLCSPQTAVVSRLRGDEFAVLLPDSHAQEALALAQRIQAGHSTPFLLAGLSLDVSAKVGIALYPDHGLTPHDLFRHVDIALHHAKKNGLDRAVFDAALDQNRAGRLTLAGELRRAIECGELALYLQPKVDMATGQVCGAEALVRWQHAQRGVIMPVEFIGLAESTGLIGALTEWMIEAALRWNQVWGPRGYAMPIAVNLSARDLRNVNLLEKIHHLRAIHGIGVGLLEIEITETAVMEDGELALRVLHALRDDGIALYIDDFGTGYSSLAYLQKMPVGYIKIDRSFVSDMTTSKDSALIVGSTVELAHDLGRRVVAEGVETQEQWRQLLELGCDFAQGYFIARPMPAHEFPGWLAQFQSMRPDERT